METVLPAFGSQQPFETARSSLPSRLKSAVAMPIGVPRLELVTSDLLRATLEAGSLIGKKIILEMPPPGPGLTIVTVAVLALAMSEVKTLAVNCELLTNVVARALPFQFTTDPETKPVPFTVSVNPAPPGATASGTSGWLISGTGFGSGRSKAYSW